jgi:hypothetical protein
MVPQVVSQNSHLLAPIAVDAVLKVIDPATATNVDLRDIRVSVTSIYHVDALCRNICLWLLSIQSNAGRS